jgi:hypothetical protein
LDDNASESSASTQTILDSDTVERLVPADDTTPWDLLHDGRLVAIELVGHVGHVGHVRSTTNFRIVVDHLGREFVVRLHGLERLVWVPYGVRSDRGDYSDEPPITELEAIVAAEPMLVRAEWLEAERTMIVWGSLGSLRLGYAALELEGITVDELSALNSAYWQRWREYWQARKDTD